MEKTLTGWNNPKVIQTYFHNSQMQKEWALSCLAQHQFEGKEHILDYGCGDGKITAHLALQCPQGQVVGVDLSSGMTAFAAETFPLPNLSFHSFQDFRDFYWPTAFDVVTSFCVFQLVRAPRSTFAKLYALTKPGGKFILTYPVGTNPAFVQASKETMAVYELEKEPAAPDSAAMRNLELLRELLEDADFSIKTMQSIAVQYLFPSKGKMVDWCVGTLTGNWKIPNALSREFFEKVVDLYCIYVPDSYLDNGAIYFPLDRFEIYAIKGN